MSKFLRRTATLVAPARGHVTQAPATDLHSSPRLDQRDLPSLAVAIPCFNAEPWIARAIDSVLGQDYPSSTVIVVDDGSSDGSLERVRGYGDDVVQRTGPNRGACHARNEGLRLAAEHGASHVLFLDADDYLEGELLAGAAETSVMRGADIVLSNMHLELADGRRKQRFRYSGRVAPEALFEGWMLMDYVNPSAILWRTDFVQRIGGWDESLARAQDLDITLRAMLHHPVIWKNECGAAVHCFINRASVSNNVSRRATESRLRVQERLLGRIEGTSFERYAPLLCREIYSISRAAFRTGEIDLGRRGMEILRAQRFRGHVGTIAHRLAASLLGLEAKVRIWGR